MTIDEAIQNAAKHLPEGFIIRLEIEKHGHSLSLVKDKESLEMDCYETLAEGICDALSVAEDTEHVE
ncbi:hypothetical protein [uncultured Paraglaciecola sp.]|uniref:hypothetical protein n=1 Tax=uncultured Paraglaciecola sp. TaxID=1765024 RepID=UPI00262D47FF|nr:hypothetical protein [uncultured Paraglaciecola sp.]